MLTELRSLQLRGKTVLLRCDFNVPLDGDAIADATRIDAALDTIAYIRSQGAMVAMCSHLGRPSERDPRLSLKPVAGYLSQKLGAKVALAPDCIGDITGRLINALAPGQTLLLENLRFHPEEEANDPDFAHELARGKQVFVNDAFGAAHRAHASIVGVTRYLSERAPGFLMMREIAALRMLTESPQHPYLAILGGAKVSDKIGVIRNLMNQVDGFLIGGAMAYTFLRARGEPIGRSRVEEQMLETAHELLAVAAQRGIGFDLPIDHVVATTPDANEPVEIVAEIPTDKMGLDIGPATVERFISRIAAAKTVIWNGPLGLFESAQFARGTLAVAEALAHSQARTVLGGGDTIAAIAAQPWAGNFWHISTGGGATLEYLEGRKLPGIEALEH